MLCGFFCCVAALQAADINQLIEDGYIIIENETETEFEEILTHFMDEPVLWKTATVAKLEHLPLNGFLKNALVLFRQKNERVDNWKDFQVLSGFSDLEIETLQLFIIFKEKREMEGSACNFNSLVAGEKVSIEKNQMRLKFKMTEGWLLGGIVERDLHERHVIDHVNFSASSPLFWKKITLFFGSYRVNWGSGLFFNSNPMNVISNSGSGTFYATNAKIKSYTGSDENNHFWGAAVSFQMRLFRLYSFYSGNKLDGNFENGAVTSLDNTGYHVSETDVDNHDRLKNYTFALGSVWDNGHFQSGGMTYFSDFNYPMQDYDNQRQISGVSWFHHYRFRESRSAGEIAWSSNQKFGLTQGFVFGTDQFQTGISIRYIEPGFQSLSGSTVRHYSGNLENEKGLYYYFGSAIGKSTKISVFTDFHSRIVPTETGIERPQGTFSGIYLRQKIRGQSLMELKISRKNDLGVIKKNIAVKVNCQLSSQIHWINRLYYTKITDQRHFSQGFSTYLATQKENHHFSLGTTHYFSNNSSCYLYVYEPGIPLRYNMVTLTGTGRNYFLNYSFQANQKTKIFISARQSYKSNQNKYLFQIQLLVAL